MRLLDLKNKLKTYSDDKKLLPLFIITKNYKQANISLNIIDDIYYIVEGNKKVIVNDFIAYLDLFDDCELNKKIKIQAPNNEYFSPDVKMLFDGHGSPLLGDKLIGLIIQW